MVVNIVINHCCQFCVCFIDAEMVSSTSSEDEGKSENTLFILRIL